MLLYKPDELADMGKACSLYVFRPFEATLNDACLVAGLVAQVIAFCNKVNILRVKPA